MLRKFRLLLACLFVATLTDAVRSQETDTLIKATRQLRLKYQTSPHRPTWHFLGSEGVCFPFDPQGCIYWKGKYHVFYAIQDQGKGAWGHASSVDLVHWVHHPIPLTVKEGDPEEHVFAGGSLINLQGRPTMIYHGVNSGTCIATAEDDDLIRWKKSTHNPVIKLPKSGDKNYGKYHVWDTTGWVKDGVYYSISGDHPDHPPATNGDIAYLFRSTDMVNWTYMHPFYQSSRNWTPQDEDCSCPDFFQLGNKHVLMFISHTQGTQYYIGSYKDNRFHPELHGKMNWPGGPVFANDSLIDDKGRRIMWAWACETIDRETQLASGWSGVMTAPRVLSLSDRGTMEIRPVEELRKLRLNERKAESLTVQVGNNLTLRDIAGDSLELKLEADCPKGAQFHVLVRCSPNGEEQTRITYDDIQGVIRIDTTQSSLHKDIFQPFPYPQAAYFPKEIRQSKDIRIQEAPFKLLPNETLKLTIFLDHSMLEVFANDRQCVTQRIYPSRADSRLIRLSSTGDNVKLHTLRAWDMAPANPY